MGARCALITGGGSGIGRSLGKKLAERGTQVVLADIHLAQAEQAAAEIVAKGGQAWAEALDVRDAQAFAAVAKRVHGRAGRIDYLFNNAGIGVGGEVAHYDLRAWDDVCDVNIRGVAYGIQAVYGLMRAQGFGHIINTASMSGLLPHPGAASYSASKHAVVGLTKALRIEAARYGVRVSVLCPGVIRTPILTVGRQVGRQVSKETIEKVWKRLHPMDPDRFAASVLKDVDANVATIIVPRWWRAVWWAERVSPGLMMWLQTRQFRALLHAFDSESPDASPHQRPKGSNGSAEIR